MNLDSLTQTSGEWLRGTGPEVRHRHLQPHPPGPQPGRLSLHQPGQRPPEGRDRSAPARSPRQARLRSHARLPQRRRPAAARPPVPGRTAAHQPGAGQRRRAARRRLRRRRNRQHHGQRGGPPPPAGDAQRLRPRRGLAGHRPRRRRPRTASQLRLQRGIRLPDRLPDQRRHRHAGQRHAAPAGPGADQADRKGLPRPAKDQPGRPRPVRRRQPGLGRLLPDFQPGDARQERDDDPRRNPRGHSADHRLRTAGPQTLHARKPPGPCTTAWLARFGTLCNPRR